MEHLEEIIVCPICEVSDSNLKLEVCDHMVSQETFTIVACSTCGLLRTSPRPSKEFIGRYYDSPNYKSHNETGRGVYDVLYHLLRGYAANEKVRFMARKVAKREKIRALLDVGCGIGVFLGAAKKQNWKVFGVEISENARKQAEKRLKMHVFEKIEDLPGEQKFDGISLFHVLEHLPDPIDTLQTLFKRAENGAALVLALPNPESWDAKHYGAQWAAWDVPIHFWHFTQGDIARLANKTGWIMESVHPMRLDAYYVSLLSESFRHGSKRWIAATWKGFWSNLQGGGSNTSSLLYVLRKPS